MTYTNAADDPLRYNVYTAYQQTQLSQHLSAAQLRSEQRSKPAPQLQLGTYLLYLPRTPPGPTPSPPPALP